MIVACRKYVLLADPKRERLEREVLILMHLSVKAIVILSA
jgi:hypothetical protein